MKSNHSYTSVPSPSMRGAKSRGLEARCQGEGDDCLSLAVNSKLKTKNSKLVSK